jgi:hypothetical protein
MTHHLFADPVRERKSRPGTPGFLPALLAAFAAASFPALAQPGGEGRPPRPPVDVALDTNGDGVIDGSEIAGAAVSLRKLDADADGTLTGEELRPARPGGAPAGGTADRPPAPDGGRPEGDRSGKRGRSPLVSTLDADGDGVINAKELSAAPAALKKLDADGDGRLSQDEVRPRRPGGGAPTDPKGRP